MQDKREQEINIRNLNEVSFYFVFIVGFIHILTGLLFTNEYLIKSSWLTNRLLDIPFLVVTLIYFYTNIKLYLLNKNITSTIYDLILISSFSLIGLSAFFADLIFSNKLPF